MKSLPILLATFFLVTPFANAATVTLAGRQLPEGRFGNVTTYMPQKTPDSVAIFVSGDGGWNLGVVDMAQHLRDAGAAVVGVDIRQYIKSLSRKPQGCESLAVDFENLSHQVQKELGLPQYRVPVLVGYSSGATLVYAALAQSPPGTFAGAVSLGFCSDLECGDVAFCKGEGLDYSLNKRGDPVFKPATHLQDQWILMQGQIDQVCDAASVDAFAAQIPHAQVIQLPLVGHGYSVERNWLPQFQAAFRQLAARAVDPPSPASDVQDLPLVEVPAKGKPADPERANDLVVLLTGDGGWSGLDRALSDEFAAQGIATVGLNSLKYFWTARTAEDVSQDLARVITHYMHAWNKSRVVLVGYSFGADVMPFALNRLPAELRQHIATVNLLGLSSSAWFEIHVSGWLTGGPLGVPVVPEIRAMRGYPVLCLYGNGEKDTPCPDLPQQLVTSVQIGDGHHFSGDYATLARHILTFSDPQPATH